MLQFQDDKEKLVEGDLVSAEKCATCQNRSNKKKIVAKNLEYSHSEEVLPVTHLDNMNNMNKMCCQYNLF